MVLKEHDFVEIEYTGKLKDTGDVFDTTNEAVAKEAGIFRDDLKFGSVVICLGAGFMMKGLEDALVGKDIGEHEIDLDPEHGFGKKSAKLIHLVPTKKFIEQQIRPMPGLQINMDGLLGTIKTVSGGRTIVDFNPPLAGKDLAYNVNIKKLVVEDKEKAQALLNVKFGIKVSSLDLKDGILDIKTEKEIPKEMQDGITEKVKELTKITNVKYAVTSSDAGKKAKTEKPVDAPKKEPVSKETSTTEELAAEPKKEE